MENPKVKKEEIYKNEYRRLRKLRSRSDIVSVSVSGYYVCIVGLTPTLCSTEIVEC